MNLKITNDQFSEMVTQAKAGEVKPLHRFLQQLYRQGKQGLLGLTQSETDAEEYFAAAVARFWEKFVVGDAALALPQTNIGGYIYTMAKFLYLDHKRSAKISVPLEPVEATAKAWIETPKTANDHREEEQEEEMRKKALLQAIARLGEHCRELFQTVMETGRDKPRELFVRLGLENARAVSVLRYECTRQLKIKAARELELLIQEASST